MAHINVKEIGRLRFYGARVSSWHMSVLIAIVLATAKKGAHGPASIRDKVVPTVAGRISETRRLSFKR